MAWPKQAWLGPASGFEPGQPERFVAAGISKRGYELFLNGIRMTYAKFINGRFMNLAYVIHMPFKNSAILATVAKNKLEHTGIPFRSIRQPP